MQGVMWVILGVTVGMAALVNHSRRQALRVELSPPMESGNIVFQVPATWKLLQPSADQDHSTRRLVARAVEPMAEGESTPGRSITIYRDVVDVPFSPIHYLFERENLAEALRDPSESSGRSSVEMLPFTPIEIAGSPGVMIELLTHSPDLRDGRQVRGGTSIGTELVACTILPSRQALIVKLQAAGESVASDSQILKQVASAIEMRAEPRRGSAGESVSLARDTRVRVPRGLVPIYEEDPNRTSQVLWFEGEASEWMTVELVPCVLLLNGTGDDERRAVANIASVRDRELRRATVSNDGPRRWRIDPPAAPSSAFAPRRLYLLGDDRGDGGTISAGPRRAILADFHGVAGSELRFDAVWNAIASGTSFTGSTEFAAMLTTGEAQAQSLMNTGLATLAEAQPSAETWWLALNPASTAPMGYSTLTWDALRPLGRRAGTFVRQGGTSTVQFTQSWSGVLNEYRCITETRINDASGTSIESEVTELRQGELRTDLIRAREKPVTWKRLAPPQFVPGAWLPALAGQLRTDSPMILQTDSILGFETISPTEPMALLISSAASAGEESRRTLSIEVNGSGKTMTWHIAADGTLDRVDLPGGARRVKTDEASIREAFDLDSIE